MKMCRFSFLVERFFFILHSMQIPVSYSLVGTLHFITAEILIQSFMCLFFFFTLDRIRSRLFVHYLCSARLLCKDCWQSQLLLRFPFHIPNQFNCQFYYRNSREWNDVIYSFINCIYWQFQKSCPIIIKNTDIRAKMKK